MKQEKREYGYRSNAYIDGNTVRKRRNSSREKPDEYIKE